ncbi:MAG: hypothetical protein O3A51_05525 [Verrucomicrobia bacterium]|nr:hypothetical protein [Verrucomicrobiota bacterium]
MKKNAKLSWVVFLLIGGGMYVLRYKDVLSSKHLSMLIEYGPYLLLVIHISLILRAFQDSVFQGILALLIPLYSFYWLFVSSDDFMVRAVVAGLLVGIGMDSAIFYQEYGSRVFNDVHAFISSGGGEVKGKF